MSADPAQTSFEKINKKLLLFIPAYNCSVQIQRVLATLKDRVPSAVHEIIVVNNRSTDVTASVVDSYIGNLANTGICKVSHLLNDENYGLGGSHKVAFEYALSGNFDGVITLHGDDQANLADFHEPLKAWLGGDISADAILGSRFSRGSKIVGYAFHRTWGNYLLNLLWSIILLRPISDIGSGLNLISTDALRKLDFNRLPNSLVFNPQQLLELLRAKCSFIYYPIQWKEEDQQSNAVPWRIFLLSLQQVVNYRLGINPLPTLRPQGYTYQVIRTGYLK